MNTQDIVDWYRRDRRPQISGGRAQELYFLFHPRIAFLKTLPAGAIVADIGAGDGSLSTFRDWPEPKRRDLRLYAYSIEKGERFDAFEGYEISDWNKAPPRFDGITFDAIVCAHFVEHIADPTSLAKWAREKLRVGGRIYIEWPSPASTTLPSRSELEVAGVPLVISNYHDDATHGVLPDRDEVMAQLSESGFSIEQQGVIHLPWIEEELMASFRDAADAFPRQAAFWSMTGWAQYIVATCGEAKKREGA